MLVVLLAAGCASPLERTAEQRLREQLAQSNRAYLEAVAAGPVVEVSRPIGDLERELTTERIVELDRIGGPTSYEGVRPDLGADLLGRDDTPTVALSLRRAIHLAVKNNLIANVARLEPAIAQARITQALAEYDPVYFLNVEYQKLDTPRPPTSILSPVFGTQQTETTTVTTGLRKQLYSGGVVTAQTSFSRNFQDPTPFTVSAYESADVLIGITQPLLRNFGSSVNRAQIQLATSARRQSAAELHRTLLDVAQAAERAYWELVLAQQRVLIQTRLVQRSIADRDRIVARRGYDLGPVAVTEAHSLVELRRADLIRVRLAARAASDALKRLMNARDLPVASETMIVPVDAPADVPVSFSLLDSITTALRHRPELRQALLQIDDATIRQRVADNQLLPRLDVSAAVRVNGIGNSFGEAYDTVSEMDFIDYLLAGQFEVPLGNRGAAALLRQTQLQRRQSVINYQRVAQDVVLEVKNAMRELLSAYQIIGAARAARRAAADNLRALQVQEEAGAALTGEFLLDRKLPTLQRLADAETQEMQALSAYNTAIANLYRTMGTLLEHSNIQFDPEALREEQEDAQGRRKTARN